MRKAVLELEAPDRRLINNIHLIYILMKHLCVPGTMLDSVQRRIKTVK